MPKRSGGPGRPKSEYGTQFHEKQFKRYFTFGASPESVVELLESRLDNIVYRAGFAITRKFARQLVSHGHFKVNGKNVDIPSYRAKIGDEISVHPLSQSIIPFKDLSITLKKHEPPAWFAIDADKLSIRILSAPKVDDSFISSSIKPIIEFYSR